MHNWEHADSVSPNAVANAVPFPPLESRQHPVHEETGSLIRSKEVSNGGDTVDTSANSKHWLPTQNDVGVPVVGVGVGPNVGIPVGDAGSAVGL